MTIQYSRYAEVFLEKYLEEIEVTSTQYDAAVRAYHSLSEWLQRPDSSLEARSPKAYVQGSFRLGTAVRPVAEDGDLDVDVVCEIEGNKNTDTQRDIKEIVGVEVASYARSRRLYLDRPGKRCWTLHYAEDTNFHMDILPAIPDGAYQREILEQSRLDAQYSETSIAITDNQSPNYQILSRNWPHSNPKGYATWFRRRGGREFERRRQALFEATNHGTYADVEDIPQFRVKTPLQGVVQLLKRHRDLMFEGRSREKPISIILATLSAQSYDQEANLAEALYSVLYSMDRYIEDRDGVVWIQNPTDPLENFADKWATVKKLEDCFYEWLEQARDDFEMIARASSGASISEAIQIKFGERSVRSAVRNSISVVGLPVMASNTPHDIRPVPDLIRLAPHKQAPTWQQHPTISGDVEIVQAHAGKTRWRSARIRSGDKALPKNYKLRFRAKTNVHRPYQVFWQTLNTGAEALGANGLRGGITTAQTEEGGLLRKESTSYTGSHSVECFIVKDGYLVARSGEFVVNII